MPKRGRKNPSQFLGHITPIKEGKKWVLKSLCLGMVTPIGSRLHRGDPWPISGEMFATKKEALVAADKLNQYLGVK